MKVVRETCIAGPVIDVTIKVSSGDHTRPRKSKREVTRETVQKVNDRNAQKHLQRIINANFDSNSYHDTLTYRNAVTPEEAKKILRNFINRVGYRMKKQGIEFKWIVATEYKGHRIHHHFITNAPIKLIKEQWKEGWIFGSMFWEDQQDYSQLADYIIKNTSDSFRDNDSSYGERYSRSRNLIKPVPQREDVSVRVLFEDEPEPRKGYEVIKDSIRRYQHPITGIDYIEYKMISIEDKPRIKKYYKGKPVTKESYWKYINNVEEQLKFLDEIPF